MEMSPAKPAQKPPHVLELEAIVSRYNLKFKKEFLDSVKWTPNGFCFLQARLGRGCLMGLFLGVWLPFCFWIYPGHRQTPPPVITLAIVTAAVFGWVACIEDILRRIVIIVEPGRVTIERRWLGIRVRKYIAPGLGELAVYQKATNPNTRERYSLRLVGHRTGFPIFLRYEEAEVLKALIDHTVARKIP